MKVKMIVEKQMEVHWQGKPKFAEKTYPSATFVLTLVDDVTNCRKSFIKT
jgi:hypothetical protein